MTKFANGYKNNTQNNAHDRYKIIIPLYSEVGITFPAVS